MHISNLTDPLRIFSGRRLKHPVYLIYFITSRCMGRCKHCFYWNHLNQQESPLNIDEVDKIAASMGRIYQLILTGGEPFLREDFTEIVERFYIHNEIYHLGVATSGYNPHRVENDIKKLLQKYNKLHMTIGLPIDGPAELNDEIRGVQGSYAKTVETFFRLKELKKHFPRLNILIDITVSAFNRGRLEETYRHILNDLEPDLINAILTRGNTRDQTAKQIDTDEVAKLYSLMEEDIKHGQVKGYNFLSRLLHAKDIILRRTALDIYKNNTSHYLPCEAGRTIGVLMPEGDVYACELSGETIGNLRQFDYNFPALWQSENALKIRKEILDSKCTCYHQCFLSNTLFWNVKSWPGMISELLQINRVGKP